MDWVDLLAVHQNHCWQWLRPWNWKMLAPWNKSYDKLSILKKQRYHFANKGPSSQSCGFSSSHVWMWELDYKESWALKNWCFWTVVLEKTLGDKESTCLCRRLGFDPWVRKIPWRRKWQPSPVLLPEESHGQRSLAAPQSMGSKE